MTSIVGADTFQDVRTSRCGNNHVDLEFTNDVEQILPSVGEEVAFTQAVATPDGGWEFSAQHDLSGVRAYYERRNAAIEVLTSRPIIEISSAWHTFMEGVSEIRDRATGEIERLVFLALLVRGAGSDDLVGEHPWSRHDGRRRDPAGDDNAVPLGRMEVLDAHERYLSALRGGDAAGAAACFAPNAGLAARHEVDGAVPPRRTHGREGLERYFTDVLAATGGVTIECINRVCGEWYVYADELWSVPSATGGPAAYRVVEYLPLATDLRFVARVGYVRPVDAPAA